MTQSSDNMLDAALQQARAALGSRAQLERLHRGLELKLAQGAAPQLTAASSGAVWPKLLLVAALGGGGAWYALHEGSSAPATTPPSAARQGVAPPVIALAPAPVMNGPAPFLLPLSAAGKVSPAARKCEGSCSQRTAAASAKLVQSAATHALPSAAAGDRPGARAELRATASAQLERSADQQGAALDPDQELTLISRAQSALRTQPLAALVSLDEHAWRFPRGLLAQEREALRIDAERALGRVDAAREHARHFVDQYPRSPQARPLSRWLAAEHKTGSSDRHTP